MPNAKQRLTIFKENDYTAILGQYKTVYFNGFEQYTNSLNLAIDPDFDVTGIDILSGVWNFDLWSGGVEQYVGAKTGLKSARMIYNGGVMSSGTNYISFWVRDLNPAASYLVEADIAGFYSLTGTILPYVSGVGAGTSTRFLVGGVNTEQNAYQYKVLDPILPSALGEIEVRLGVFGYDAGGSYGAPRWWVIDNIRVTQVSFPGGGGVGPAGVIEPTFTTHDIRPYLKWNEEGPQREVTFAEGKTSIGSINVEVVDKRTDVADQSSGIVTSLLAENGKQQWVGHRAIYEEWDYVDSVWRLVLDGYITSMELTDELVTYKLSIADIRERERKTRVFVRGYNSTVVPKGVHGGWGTIFKGTIFQKQLIPESLGYYTGVFKRVDAASPFNPASGYMRVVGPSPESLDDDQREMLIAQPYTPPDEYFSTLQGYAYTRVIGAWRAVGAIRWNYMYNMPGTYYNLQFDPNTFLSNPSSFDTTARLLIDGYVNPRNRQTGSINMWLFAETDNELPAHNSTVQLTYLSNDPPSEKFPAWIDATSLGQIAKNAYDGLYSDEDTGIAYDPDDMAALIATTPIMNLRIEKEEEDLRSWMEEHIYKTLGKAPRINEAGQITTIDYSLPEAGVSLFELTNDNVQTAQWVLDKDSIVNRVSFRYYRYYLRPVAKKGENELDRLSKREVVFKFINTSAGLLSEDELEYEPDTVTSVIRTNTLGTAESASEEGTRIAMARAKDVVSRFHSGAPRISATVLRHAVGVEDLIEGQWGSIECTWLPDPDGLVRGGARLVQILSIQKTQSHITFTLSDAGPVEDPLDMPTLDNETVNGDDSISIDVVTIPTLPNGDKADAVLRYALSEFAPGNTSPLWSIFGGTNVEGTTVTSEPLPSGASIWTQGRSQAIGFRPSPWTTPVQLTTPDKAKILSASVSFSDLGVPTISWLANVSTDDVEVCYEEGNLTSTPTYPTCVTVAGGGSTGSSYSPAITVAGSRTLFAKLTPIDLALVEGDPYYVYASRLDADELVMPTVVGVATQTPTVGTLTLTITDPQQRVFRREFKKQTGPGTITAFVEDTVAPYADTVNLTEGFESKIFWKVTYYNEDGVEAVLEGFHSFSAQNKPGPLQITVAINSTGGATILSQGDVLTATQKVAWSTTAFPDATTVRAQTALVGRAQVIDPGVTVALGQSLFVAGFAYAADGTESEIAYGIASRDGRPADAPDSISIYAGGGLVELVEMPTDATTYKVFEGKTKFPIKNWACARVVADVDVAGPGRFIAMWSNDQSGWDWLGEVDDVETTIDSVGVNAGDFAAINDGALFYDDVYLRVIAFGGDGSTSPRIRSVKLQFSDSGCDVTPTRLYFRSAAASAAPDRGLYPRWNENPGTIDAMENVLPQCTWNSPCERDIDLFQTMTNFWTPPTANTPMSLSISKPTMTEFAGAFGQYQQPPTFGGPSTSYGIMRLYVSEELAEQTIPALGKWKTAYYMRQMSTSFTANISIGVFFWRPSLGDLPGPLQGDAFDPETEAGDFSAVWPQPFLTEDDANWQYSHLEFVCSCLSTAGGSYHRGVNQPFMSRGGGHTVTNPWLGSDHENIEIEDGDRLVVQVVGLGESCCGFCPPFPDGVGLSFGAGGTDDNIMDGYAYDLSITGLASYVQPPVPLIFL